MNNVEYTLIRSARRTAALQVKEDGQLIVRVPYRMPVAQIENLIESHRAWILQKQLAAAAARTQGHVITAEGRRRGYEEAARRIPGRVAYFAACMNVTYGRISIREQKTRWGSCSSKGNLNFNWKLVLMEPEVLDYVVVHELAHRKEMNHSAAFWKEVAQVLPDYQERRRRLKGYRFVDAEK